MTRCRLRMLLEVSLLIYPPRYPPEDILPFPFPIRTVASIRPLSWERLSPTLSYLQFFLCSLLPSTYSNPSNDRSRQRNNLFNLKLLPPLPPRQPRHPKNRPHRTGHHPPPRPRPNLLRRTPSPLHPRHRQGNPTSASRRKHRWSTQCDADIVYKDMFIPRGTNITLFQYAIQYSEQRWERPEDYPLRSGDYAGIGDFMKRDHFGFGVGRRIW